MWTVNGGKLVHVPNVKHSRTALGFGHVRDVVELITREGK